MARPPDGRWTNWSRTPTRKKKYRRRIPLGLGGPILLRGKTKPAAGGEQQQLSFEMETFSGSDPVVDTLSLDEEGRRQSLIVFPRTIPVFLNPLKFLRETQPKMAVGKSKCTFNSTTCCRLLCFFCCLFSTSAQQSRDTIPFPPPTSCLSAASRASGNGKRREEPALSCTATSRSINPHRRRAPRPPLLPPLYSGRADSPPLFFTIYDSILLTLRLLAAAGFRMGNTHLYSHRAVTKSRRQIGEKKEIFLKNRLFLAGLSIIAYLLKRSETERRHSQRVGS